MDPCHIHTYVVRVRVYVHECMYVCSVQIPVNRRHCHPEESQKFIWTGSLYM